MAEFLSADFIKFFLPLVGAVVAWLVNRHRERQLEEYRRKEERYRELMLALRGFHDNQAPAELRQKFLDQFYLCWLYCPDDVIRSGLRFIESVADGNKASDDDRQLALGTFVMAIRKDLLSRAVIKETSLAPSEFRPLNANRQLPGR